MRSNESMRHLSKLFRTKWTDFLKKVRLENSLARTYCQQLKHFYLALDEMRQCTSRLEFYPDDRRRYDRRENRQHRFRFDSQTIDNEGEEFQRQATNYIEQAEKHRRQFHFFQQQQQDYYRSIDTNSHQMSTQRTKCPMCHELFGDDRPNVCFFLCGHFFCQPCTLRWKQHEIHQRSHRTHLKCPICTYRSMYRSNRIESDLFRGRRAIPIHSLTVLQWRDDNSTDTTPVNTTVNDTTRIRRLMETQEHLTIQGRYGTKVDSIVSFIVDLINNDVKQTTDKPPLKILLFSQFTDILNVIGISLKLNAVSYLEFTSNKVLQEFRQDRNIVVLLMTLDKGFDNSILSCINQ
jgi:hypothetical protein